VFKGLNCDPSITVPLPPLHCVGRGIRN
jgi:hypothetical protein